MPFLTSPLPRTFFDKAHSVETFRTFDGGEGQIIHHDGLLAEVLRVRGLTPQKAGAGWGSDTRPYHAASVEEWHKTIQLRRRG